MKMKKQLLKTLLIAIGTLNINFVMALEYRVYSAAGIKIPMIELTQIFNQSNPLSPVVNDFDTAGAAENKFLADKGSACLITTQSRIDRAIQTGALQGHGALPLVDTVAGIAFSGPVKPKISNTPELIQALQQAKSIAFSDPARGATVGLHFQQMIKKLGLEKEVMAKAILAKDGVETMQLVSSKKVELGITQVSEIIQADASTLVGPFPAEFELSSRYALWCKNPSDEGVQQLINLLKSDRGAQTLTQHGLRVVK
jgi:molybdate transport system substrate-binding protein